MEQKTFNTDQILFSGEKIDKVALIRFKKNLLLNAIDISAKETLFEYFDWVSRAESIHVVLMIGSPDKIGGQEYLEFYRKISKSGSYNVHRLYNAVNQFILKVVDLNKIIVHADSGKVIPLFMNVSLACDYRIIGKNTIFENPNIELGMVPKGGGVFFLSKALGFGKTLELMLAETDLTADEAKALGIVDQVVEDQQLDEVALKTAQAFASKPTQLLHGIKKLMNCCKHELKDCLECENQLLLENLVHVKYALKQA